MSKFPKTAAFKGVKVRITGAIHSRATHTQFSFNQCSGREFLYQMANWWERHVVSQEGVDFLGKVIAGAWVQPYESSEFKGSLLQLKLIYPTGEVNQLQYNTINCNTLTGLLDQLSAIYYWPLMKQIVPASLQAGERRSAMLPPDVVKQLPEEAEADNQKETIAGLVSDLLFERDDFHALTQDVDGRAIRQDRLNTLLIDLQQDGRVIVTRTLGIDSTQPRQFFILSSGEQFRTLLRILPDGSDQSSDTPTTMYRLKVVDGKYRIT